MSALKTFLFAVATAGLVALTALTDSSAQEQPSPRKSASQTEMNQNAIDEFKRADDELTKTFEKALAAQGSPQLRDALEASQRAWISFRDADARYESLLGEGGSARTQYVHERRTYLTRLRIYQLQTPFASGWHELPPASK